MRTWPAFRRHAVALLCIGLAVAPAARAEASAGKISALVPAASRNDAAARLQEDLEWNDRLRTDVSGRMRARLGDGSVLSLGAATELTVVRHDAGSQQTRLELTYGKLRSMVTPLRQRGSSFRINTAAGVVGVIGTDFYLDSEKGHLVLICFSGTASVESTTGEKYTVKAGQVLEVGGPGQPGIRKASSELVRDALRQTSIPGQLDVAPGTRLEATLTSTLDAAKLREGAPVVAKVTRDVRIGSVVVLPKGSELAGTVTEVARQAKKQDSRLAIAFSEVRLAHGETFAFASVIDGIGSDEPPPETLEGLAGSSNPPTPAGSPTRGVPVTSGARGLGSTLGAATGTVSRTAEPVNSEAGTVAASAPGREALPPLRPLPDITVTPKIADSGSGALITSSRNVRLAKGTVLVVRVLAR